MTLRGTHIALLITPFITRKFWEISQSFFTMANQKIISYRSLNKFKKHFEIIPYQQFNDINKIAEKNAIDAIYIIKSGEIDDKILESIPNLIHAVFPQKIEKSMVRYMHLFLNGSAESVLIIRFPMCLT